jgi:hypothetical protein
MKMQTEIKSPLFNWLLYGLFTLLVGLYIYTAWSSAGYDDEFYNIRVVREYSLSAMIHLIQSEDLHPPLSYILNYLLFHSIGSWQLVRLFSAFLYLGSLWYLLRSMANPKMKLLALLLLGLNPTILIWVTGLRWYAYLIPVLMALNVLPDYAKWYYWPKYFLLMLIACFLGYAGFFLAIPYFLYYWLNDERGFTQKVKKMITWILLFVLAYAYQAYIFITVHSKMDLSKTNNQQVFDLKSNIISFVSSIASNQGLFPLSIGGICAIAGSIIIYLAAIFSFKQINQQKHWLVFVLLSVLFFITGIAGKVRNLVLLEPSRNNMLLGLLNAKKRIVWLGFLLIITGNIAGTYNAIAHTKTTKNAWNIPVDQTLRFLNSIEEPDATEIYFTHHPSFDYHLTTSKKKVVCFYTSSYFDSSWINTKVVDLQNDHSALKKNFTFLINYRGRSITIEQYEKLMLSMNSLKADSIKRFYLDKDPEYSMRKKFFPDYPEYTTVIVKFYGVKGNVIPLEVWETNK